MTLVAKISVPLVFTCQMAQNGPKHIHLLTWKCRILYFSLFMKQKNCNEQLRVTPEGEKTSPTWKYSDARPWRVRKHIFWKEKKWELSEQNIKAVKNKKWFFHFLVHPVYYAYVIFHEKCVEFLFSFFTWSPISVTWLVQMLWVN